MVKSVLAHLIFLRCVFNENILIQIILIFNPNIKYLFDKRFLIRLFKFYKNICEKKCVKINIRGEMKSKE